MVIISIILKTSLLIIHPIVLGSATIAIRKKFTRLKDCISIKLIYKLLKYKDKIILDFDYQHYYIDMKAHQW